MITVLGIDPGTHRLGWGVITGTAQKQVYVASGCIESKVGTKPEVYLPTIANTLQELINRYKPTHIGLESLLFQKNVATAISVAEARGVILLTSAQAKVPVHELAPNTIKLGVAGSGSATKQEVTRMVGLLLGLDVRSRLDDELDALAVAISTCVTKKNL
jgi:crossover junction endodeoxyribonuclease RuvC